MTDRDRSALFAFRPNPVYGFGCAVALAAAVGLGASLTGFQALGSTFADPSAMLLATALSTSLAAPYLFVLLWIDRHEPEPWYLILAAVTWGAIGATGIAIVGNLSAEALFLFSGAAPDAASALTASLSAPPVEESAKGLALLAMLLLFRDQLHGPVDGMLYGAMVGLGFEWTENIAYIYAAHDEGPRAMVVLGLMRGGLGAPGTHAAWCALTGLGAGIWRANPDVAIARLALPLGWSMAIAGHFVWNTFAGMYLLDADLRAWSALLSYLRAAMVLQLPALALLALALALAWQHEDALLHTWLHGEPDDVVREGDADHLLPGSQRQWGIVRAWLRSGFRAARTRRALGHLLLRLAFARWRHHTDRAPWQPEQDEEIAALRAEVRRLRAAGARLD